MANTAQMTAAGKRKKLEFGHEAVADKDADNLPVFIDAWGSGPFVIVAAGESFRFGDSDRIGPYLCNRNGDPLAKAYPAERSPFWRAHRVWVRQGRRMENLTCVWDEPRPTKIVRINRRNVLVVENGEYDGELLILDRTLTPDDLK